MPGNQLCTEVAMVSKFYSLPAFWSSELGGQTMASRELSWWEAEEHRGGYVR